jgi:hypothetical protein
MSVRLVLAERGIGKRTARARPIRRPMAKAQRSSRESSRASPAEFKRMPPPAPRSYGVASDGGLQLAGAKHLRSKPKRSGDHLRSRPRDRSGAVEQRAGGEQDLSTGLWWSLPASVAETALPAAHGSQTAALPVSGTTIVLRDRSRCERREPRERSRFPAQLPGLHPSGGAVNQLEKSFAFR